MDLTGPTEGDGAWIEASGDGRWRLNMEDDERTGRLSGTWSRGSELEVIDRPSQGVHALLAAINGHDHASQVTRHDYYFEFDSDDGCSGVTGVDLTLNHCMTITCRTVIKCDGSSGKPIGESARLCLRVIVYGYEAGRLKLMLGLVYC